MFGTSKIRNKNVRKSILTLQITYERNTKKAKKKKKENLNNLFSGV